MAGEDGILPIDEEADAAYVPKHLSIVPIFRVPRYDNDAEENGAYQPEYISIGPFHHGKDALKLMEQAKQRSVAELLHRDSRLKDKCTQMVKEQEQRAKEQYYSDISLESGKFAEMLVIDGCFIIEFLCRYYLYILHEKIEKEKDEKKRKERECEFDKAITSTPLLKYFVKETKKPAFLDWKDLFFLLRSDILYRLENQIPFFILEALYSQLSDGSIPEKEDGTKIRGLTDLALFYIHMGDEKSPPLEPIPDHHVYHLLHLFHDSNRPVTGSDKPNEGNTMPTKENLCCGALACFVCLPMILMSMQKTETKEGTENQPAKESDAAKQEQKSQPGNVVKACYCISLFLLLPTILVLLLVAAIILVLLVVAIFLISLLLPLVIVFLIVALCRLKKPAAWPSDDEESVASRMIPSATDLRNAGIKFEKKDADNFLDVIFDQKSKLEIPVFSITEETARKLQNLIALEKHLPLQKRYFTSYAALMMNLMETKEDVSILKSHGILKSKLGSDKQVPRFFIKLCKAGHFSYRDHHYKGLFENLKSCYESKWSFYRWRVILIPDYFTNPWAIPTMMAGSLLLILAVLQTVYTILSYY